MNIADAWVKLLFTYGPFAILALLIFVAEKKTRVAKNEALNGERKSLIAVYILNWVAIFGLVVFATYAWSLINLDQKPTIEGRIDNLSNLESLTTSSANLYLYKIPITNRYSDYRWLLVNDKRFDDGATIKFTIDRSNANGGDSDVYEYELPIQSDFYTSEVHLQREQDKLMLHRRNATPTELYGRKLPLVSQPLTAQLEPARESFTRIAYVQGSFSANDFAVGLESQDAIVRRNTRADLAKQGQAAVPWIEKVLANQNGSYRLKLGVIVALNNMPNLRFGEINSSTVAAIQNAGMDRDEALRTEALNFLTRYNTALTPAMPVVVFEHIAYGGHAQGFGPGKYRVDKGQFGNLPNDSASSLRVARGYRIRLCEHEGEGNGGGTCEEFGEGEHQLKDAKRGGVADQVSYIQVTRIAEKRLSRTTATPLPLSGNRRQIALYPSQDQRVRRTTLPALLILFMLANGVDADNTA